MVTSALITCVTIAVFKSWNLCLVKHICLRVLQNWVNDNNLFNNLFFWLGWWIKEHLTTEWRLTKRGWDYLKFKCLYITSDVRTCRESEEVCNCLQKFGNSCVSNFIKPLENPMNGVFLNVQLYIVFLRAIYAKSLAING